ncbi:MAG: N-acetylneuraminate synthase [Chloroflexota bacterium]|nr:N-acetylneuraminate synthase [Chloroflexota bacterium]
MNVIKSNTLIIAEIGVNHDGDLNKAEQLIDVAANAGADLVKFQTFNAERLVTSMAPKAEYQSLAEDEKQSQLDMLCQLELSHEMHEILIEHCEKKGVGFFSTAFDTGSIDYLVSLGIDRFKVPSGEITDLPYLRHVGSYGKSIILSTGMATLGEIEAAIDALEYAGTPRKNITVLHCNSEYPTPVHDVNLLAMCSIRDAFKVDVGYSDHTLGIDIPIAAVALGAKVIEKHLTLNRNHSGPDHKASLEPHEFTSMVRSIRNIEKALGDGIKRPSSSEIKNKHIARKSLVASRHISIGEKFTAENVTTKRAGKGISPMRIDEIIGKSAVRSFQPDDIITLS